jgi:hypothetical protein
MKPSRTPSRRVPLALASMAALTLTASSPALAEESATAAAPAERKVQLGGGLLYALPQGDFKELQGMDLVGNSPGIALGGSYEILPKLSAIAMLRYFKVSSELDGVDLGYWDIDLGARYAHPLSPVMSIYGEAYAQRAASSVDANGFSSDSSGFGFAAGGGILYRVAPRVTLCGGLSYSSTSLEPDEGDAQSSGWLSLNAFALYGL